MAVKASDILLRCGGATLRRLQTLASAGPGRIESPHTYTRADAATCATFRDRDGTSRLASANRLRLDWPSGLVDASGNAIGGPLQESTRTCIPLWNRDMTNAAWTKVTMTTAKDQVGIDGVANSASSLLATGANSTCLQNPVIASSSRFSSAYLKRLIGTGNIQMSAPDGLSFITVTITSSWARYTVPAITVANPRCGFRVQTSGDKIAVDFVQNETGTFCTSPIATTTAAVTRATDSLTVPFNWGPQDITVLVRLARPPHADTSGALGVSPGIFSFGAGSAPRIGLYFDPAARNIISVIDTATTDATQTTAIPAGDPVVCVQYRNLTTGGSTALDVGSGFTAFSSAATAFSAFGAQTLRVGRYDDELNGVIGDIVIARGLYTRAEMAAIP